jgi:hypothetical protein
MIGGTRDIVESTRPGPTFITHPSILDGPRGYPGACKRRTEMRDMAQVILRAPAPAVHDYGYRVRTRPAGQPQLAKI